MSKVSRDGSPLYPAVYSGGAVISSSHSLFPSLLQAAVLGASILCASLATAGPRPFSQEPEEKPTNGNAAAHQKDAPKTRSIAEIHRDLRRLDKGTAKSKNDAARAANIVALCRLFVEVGEHPETPKSHTLQNLSVRLRTRLRGLDRRTSDELKRRGIQPPAELIQEERDQRAARAQFGSLANAHQALARKNISHLSQQKSAGEENNTGSQTNSHRDSSKSKQSSFTAGSHSESEFQSSEQAGQGTSLPGNAAPGPDYGWQLVNLIRMTIRPDYWSIAGGPGKAIYFGHSRALVVHGSWRVQEDVAELLTALRGG
jgi:hypothetical protein